AGLGSVGGNRPGGGTRPRGYVAGGGRATDTRLRRQGRRQGNTSRKWGRDNARPVGRTDHLDAGARWRGHCRSGGTNAHTERCGGDLSLLIDKAALVRISSAAPATADLPGG